MSDSHNINKDVVENLLKEKFGKLYDWKMPVIRKTVGPYSPTVFTSFEARRIELIDACKKVLEKNEPPDLAGPFHPESDNLEMRVIAWENLLGPEITKLSRDTPGWVSGGFGHPDFEADFEYWGQMAEYKLDEALVLSVGVEPRHFGERSLEGMAKRVDQNRLYPALEYLAKRREQFRRKFPTGYSGWLPISPRDLKAWFDEISLDVHVDFYAQLKQRLSIPKAKVTKEPEKNISLQERETLLKLIAAMSCEQYGFDPKKSKNLATSSIQHDIETVGLSMDSNTIRKWVREAAALVAKEYWEK